MSRAQLQAERDLMAKLYDLTVDLTTMATARRTCSTRASLNDVGRKFQDPAPLPLRRRQGTSGPLHEFRGQCCLSQPSVRISPPPASWRSAPAGISVAAAPPQTLGDLVRAGKRESVLAAITSPDVDVNEKAPDGSTALMWATFNVDRELVRALLKAGAKADVTSHYGATALGEAVKVEDIELVRMLLDAGANVNSPNLRQPDRADAGRQHRLAADLEAAGRARRRRERGGNLPRPERADVGGGRQPAGHRRPAACARREERRPARQVRRLAAPDDLGAARPVPVAPDRRTHRTALRHPLGLPALCSIAGEGGRRRQQAQSGRRHAADQCARQQALRHRDVPARQGRQSARLGHERPHAHLCGGGHELVPRRRIWRRPWLPCA